MTHLIVSILALISIIVSLAIVVLVIRFLYYGFKKLYREDQEWQSNRKMKQNPNHLDPKQ